MMELNKYISYTNSAHMKASAVALAMAHERVDKYVKGSYRACSIGCMTGGNNARPMHPDWARSLRDQCAAANVPFFFKQWGAFEQSTLYRRQVLGDGTDAVFFDEQRKDSEVDYMCKVGKKSAGRLLDGVEHNGVPK